MKILIDIGHPAHVHVFRNFAISMRNKGHAILFTAREKEITLHLMEYYKLNHISFGKPFKGLPGKALGLLKFNTQLLKTAISFKPDLFLSHGSMYAAQVSSLLRKPHISLEDTGNKEQMRLYLPFTNMILTSTSFNQNLGEKQVFYKGYHELAYLHPSTFIPDSGILKTFMRDNDRPYVILRFVSWGATHDRGHSGITMENKIKAVREFSKYADVYISSETPLPEELEPFRFNAPPELMHQAMAFASLLYGESATMASESAVLGVPAIYLDDTGRYYTGELEKKYGLVFNYSESLEDQEISIAKGVELLKKPETKELWKEKQKKMLSEKIDVTAFMVWFIENYPESKEIMKKNPDFQDRFK